MKNERPPRTRYDPERGYVRPLGLDESPTAAVIEAVADATDRDTHELTDVLYDVVSPGAIDDLFAARTVPEMSAQVTFHFCGCLVTLSNDGTVVVRTDTDVLEE